jgi:hypothetical protein
MRRDSQRSSVYDWESTHIAPHDKNLIPFDQIKLIVDWIWAEEGLKYPPLVEIMPKQKHASGDATRTCVRFQPQTYTWIILHELSHSMTANCEGENNGHGALFLGVYMQMASKYLHIPYSELMNSAMAVGLRVKMDARPVFLA